jgi:hypothetical protein
MIPIPESSKISIKNHYDIVAPLLVKRINYVIKNGVVVSKINYSVNASEKAFLDNLKKGKILRLLISSPVKDLYRIIKIYQKKHPAIFDKSKRLNRILYGIFINTEYDSLDKWRFIKRLKINTCPYCNRNYIFRAFKKSRNQATT